MLLPKVRFFVSATRIACGQGVGSFWYLWSSKCYPQNYGRLGIRKQFKTTTSKTPHFHDITGFQIWFPISYFLKSKNSGQTANQPTKQPTKPSSHKAKPLKPLKPYQDAAHIWDTISTPWDELAPVPLGHSVATNIPGAQLVDVP